MARPVKNQKSFEWRNLFEGRRKWIVITPAFLLLMGAGWWAYEKLTVLPPVEVKDAPVEEVVNYLGSERGLIQLPVAQREQYVYRQWEYARSSPELRMQVSQAMERMTPRQREVFAEAVVGIGKQKIMEASKKYNSMKSAWDRNRFAQQFYGDFKRMQSELVGAGTMAPGMNVTSGLQQAAPSSPQEIHKAVVNNSTPHERAQAEPLMDKMAEIHKNEIQEKIYRR